MVSTREVLTRLALAVSSCVLALLMVEIALRISARWADAGAGPVEESLDQSRRADLGETDERPFSLRGLVQASPYPGVVYELKPGLRGTFRGRTVEISSQGLRDREYATEKPEGVYRIAGLGDSVMFGWGVGQDESYLEVLERRLNDEADDGRRIEVLNFAVPGYNTAMEVAAFEHKALAFEPDLVILHFVSNDLRLPHFMRAPRDVLSGRRSYLLELLRSRLRSPGETSDSEDGLLGHGLEALAPDERREVREQYRHLAGEPGFRRAVGRLAELTRERSVPVVVVRLGARQEHHDLVHASIERHGFHAVTAEPYFAEHLRAAGLPLGERAWSDAFWVSRRDHHPNALGHELFASALRDELDRISAVR